MISVKNSFLMIFVILLFGACAEDLAQTPRPKGFMRIDFPEKAYLKHESSCPYSFEFPLRSLIDTNLNRLQNPCWLNIYYPQYGATMHFTYTSIKRDSLFQYIEDARNLAMKHTVRADNINERYYENIEHNVYGIAYEFEGNVASNFQFFMTDSNQHFVRGSLYFNMRPNPDSLSPVINYISKDMYRLIETLEWQGKS
tara:strand:+ start:87087 stop:87680 length:594 start_codon:yes stop_codon:yes gene_type:complete